MYKELKKAIINWLMTNEHEFNRVVACHDHFHQYIFDSSGEYIIGGREVSDFIEDANKLLYGNT